MNRRPLAAAPCSVTNVAQATLRSHSRASHGGSGTYTEMRAQIRKERENEKLYRQNNNSSVASIRDVDQLSRKQAQPMTHSNSQLASSMSDQKFSQFPANDEEASEHPSADKKGYLRVLPPSSFAMSSDNISNMSTASSQISSSSSTGVIRKRSQTVNTNDQPLSHPQQQQRHHHHHEQMQHQHQHLHQHQQLQLQQLRAQQQVTQQQQLSHASHHHHHQQQRQNSRQESVFPTKEDDVTGIHSPFEAPEQAFSVDALQAAFSAKYYELATKCKEWEKFAARLRAHVGVLEAENRVLKGENNKLEGDNAQLRAVLRQEEQTRTQLQGRMSSLEDCLSQRSLSGGNLNVQYRAIDTLDFDHLSIPSAPSSAEKNSDGASGPRHTPYCSSNLQVEDRTELRPQPMPIQHNAVSVLQTTNVSRYLAADQMRQPAIPTREASLEASHSKWEMIQPLEVMQSPQLPQSATEPMMSPEGRSSRLGNRHDLPEKHVAHQRSGTVGAFGMIAPRSGSVMGAHHNAHALTSHALARQDAIETIARPASAQRFHGTCHESNVSTTAASIVASIGVTKAALQSKRRSTFSGDRAPSLSLAQIVKGALTASGVVAAPSVQSLSRQNSPSDKPFNSSEYLQECVEKRREAMRSSFQAQQKGMTPASGQGGPSRPVSRTASRLSTQSATRSRSRAGSVHDAIPVAVEDVFCNPKTVQAHSTDTSPEFLTQQLAASHLDSHSDITAASQRLMAVADSQNSSCSSVKLMTRKELSSVSSPTSHFSTSPAEEKEEQITFERKLYIRFQQELNTDEFSKFERCIQRYDFLDIPLEGNKGLITRVKRLLLVSDPDLRSKPEKLRVRQQLARDFEKMAKNFGQAQTQPQS
ncbi:uncharacterized protein UBRO_02048 [Ustilago bromivora]|uniref:Uncharacterized protein n=1 Tax=Ustilago bromivora TaxID=307758 RepID=A0A1K0H9C2_9BASI|nr:uncharacterized protein UBRO_02048 [Ustilago bromivora]SYW79359.1 uncharacterized protein UBRO2_03043 [Ustilago bromivora]